MLFEDKENDELVSHLKRFWDLESLGIVEKDKSSAVTGILREVFYFEAGLPWKEGTPPLSND